MPLVQSIFNKTMIEMGHEVSNHREYMLSKIPTRRLLTRHSLFPHSTLSRRSLQHYRR